MQDRSPDGAKRNPGRSRRAVGTPDLATLHPGYGALNGGVSPHHAFWRKRTQMSCGAGALPRRGGALAADLALGPGQEPGNVLVMPDPEQNREHEKEHRLRPLPIDPERNRRRGAGEE